MKSLKATLLTTTLLTATVLTAAIPAISFTIPQVSSQIYSPNTPRNNQLRFCVVEHISGLSLARTVTDVAARDGRSYAEWEIEATMCLIS